jgi:hypothetical protein
MTQEEKDTQEKEQVVTVDDKKEEEAPAKESYTKEEFENAFNEKIKDRLSQKDKAILERFEAKSFEELEARFSKAKDYDSISESYKTAQTKNSELTEKLSFRENNIDPERIDDVRTYFKGKGISFSNEELVKQIETHPEWRAKPASISNDATIKKIGTEDDGNGKKQLTKNELLKRAWGI